MGHIARSLVSCVMFLDHCLSFVAIVFLSIVFLTIVFLTIVFLAIVFLAIVFLTIVFSVLRCTDSDYPLGLFKLFFRHPELD